MYTLSNIYIYPIKSLGGFSTKQAIVTDRGLQYDRRWMLIDANGVFMTQREYHQMALIQVGISADEKHLIVSHKTQIIEPLHIPIYTDEHFVGHPSIKSVIWDDDVEGFEVSTEVNSWFSEVLGQSCRLIYMADIQRRLVDTDYAIHQDITSFSDGFPVLIIGEESLNYLNQQVAETIEMERFRPNLVFSGGFPHDEDHWQRFDIGAVRLYGAKPCARCVLTTIDPATGKKGTEPLKTLATYRRRNNKIMFGQNVLIVSQGLIKVNSPITIQPS
jgi:uncharacterized protein